MLMSVTTVTRSGMLAPCLPPCWPYTLYLPGIHTTVTDAASTRISGRYNRIVTVPTPPTPINVEIAGAWMVEAADKAEAQSATAVLQQLQDEASVRGGLLLVLRI